MQSCAIGGDRVVCLTRWQTWITGYSGERTLERDTNDEVPEVRSNTCSQACARREELSPATGVPRARMAAREAACDSNEVSQRSPQLVIHSADNWVSFRLMCRAEQWRGLRMMPTFPLPSLKFRTAGFPQYGFKAGVSAFLFQRIPRVGRFASVLRAPRFPPRIPVLCRGTLCAGAPPFERPLPLYPRALAPVRVLLSRSILTYPAPSVPLAGTSRFHRLAAYPTKIPAAEPRKQRHDRRDADLILTLLAEDRFPAIWLPSKEEGDSYLRTLLVQGAHHILGPFGQDSDLRRWGLKLAERGGKNAKKRAVVAVARKLSVLLHKLWVSGEVYEPLRNNRKVMAAVA